LDANNLNSSYAGSFFMAGDPAQKTVSMRLTNVHNYELRFRTDPQSPEPPVQTGSAASRSPGAGLTNILGAVLDAIGGQVEKQGRQAEKLLERQGQENAGQGNQQAPP
jgi:hypothetical protein